MKKDQAATTSADSSTQGGADANANASQAGVKADQLDGTRQPQHVVHHRRRHRLERDLHLVEQQRRDGGDGGAQRRVEALRQRLDGRPDRERQRRAGGHDDPRARQQPAAQGHQLQAQAWGRRPCGEELFVRGVHLANHWLDEDEHR